MQTTTPPETPEAQLQELTATQAEIKSHLSDLTGLRSTVQSLQADTAQLTDHLDQVRRTLASRSTLHAPRPTGRVTDDCAQHIAAQFIAHCAKSDKLKALCSSPSEREALAVAACKSLSISTRAALTTTEITLPTQYAAQLRELISEFGVVRRQMSPYPIGMGSARPARMGTRPALGSIAMSATIGEKSPSITFASLESHKIGGIVRLPREIDEQSIVPMGQFLARYGAIEFARAEDTWGFMADGGIGYDQVKGVVQVARDTSHVLALPAGKTSPADATLDHFRALRSKVNKAALSGRLSAYYLDTTWESRLPAFRTSAEPGVYARRPDGTATLDGYPVIWTDVLEPYGTDSSPDRPIAVFGALSFWWLGEHGHPRIDTSDQVWFANDQLAIRFIEEIDFDYAAPDATSALVTANE